MSKSTYRDRVLLIVFGLFLLFTASLELPSIPDKTIPLILSLYYGTISLILALFWEKINCTLDKLDEDN